MPIVTINDENLKNIGNAIRTKTGSTSKYKPSEMANAISSIKGQEPKLQQKSVVPTTTSQTIKADSSYDGLSSVSVGAVTSAIDSDIKSENIKKGVSILGVNGTLEEGVIPSGTKTINDNGDYDVSQYANAKVNVPKGITPSGELPITENGTYDVTNFASAVVDVAGAGGGKYAPRYISFYGYDGTDLNSELENLDTSAITSMKNMFRECRKLTSIDVSKFETSQVTITGSMIRSCSSLTKIDLSNFVGENLKDAYAMFQGCTLITEVDLRKFNPQNITDIGAIFSDCSSLTKIDLRAWDISNSKSKITSKTNCFNKVPTNCEIICKHQDAVYFIRSLNTGLTNVKTLSQYQAEGGV